MEARDGDLDGFLDLFYLPFWNKSIDDFSFFILRNQEPENRFLSSSSSNFTKFSTYAVSFLALQPSSPVPISRPTIIGRSLKQFRFNKKKRARSPNKRPLKLAIGIQSPTRKRLHAHIKYAVQNCTISATGNF